MPCAPCAARPRTSDAAPFDARGLPARASYLDRQIRNALLSYLAVTHFGRGRGEYSDPREFPLFWQQETERILKTRKDNLQCLWKQFQTTDRLSIEKDSTDQLVRHLTEMTMEILLKFYPDAQCWLIKSPPKSPPLV